MDINAYQVLKFRVHERLMNLLDLSILNSLDQDRLRIELRRLVETVLEAEPVPLNLREKEALITEVQNEVLGLGPLEPFLRDPAISDILVNTHEQIYVEKAGKLELTQACFKDEAHLRKIIDKIVSAVGRRVDEASPMVDARLTDGSRVNAIIPPLALDGCILSIRRFRVDPLKLEGLVALKALPPEIGEFLKGVVRARLNVLISGGTGTGKTTLLNALSRFIPAGERIITIEDSAELQLQREHVVRLETRPPNIEGKGEVTQRDLVRNSLRMRPDRIIVGEVRGAEAIDMLQAMNTGHDGSLTTIHANSPRDALLRLETMVAMAHLNINIRSLRYYISSALNILIHLERFIDGSRRVVSIQEITGMEGDIVTLQEVFRFEQTGIDAEGKVRGQFRATGIRPGFLERLSSSGITLLPEVFDPHRACEV